MLHYLTRNRIHKLDITIATPAFDLSEHPQLWWTDQRQRAQLAGARKQAAAMDSRPARTIWMLGIALGSQSTWTSQSSLTANSGSLRCVLLQISGMHSLHWLQAAQVSWLGLGGPGTSPWSAGTSLPALIKCHADGEQMLLHPFSLVGCQGLVNFLPSFPCPCAISSPMRCINKSLITAGSLA